MKQIKESREKNIIRVNLNGDVIYMTTRAYGEFRLQLSTGDFHTHKVTKLKKRPKSVQSWKVRDAEYYNPKLKYPTVESIIEAYNNEDAFAEEYVESEESPLAEYVSSFCYGKITLEQILDSCQLTDATQELLEAYHSKYGLKLTHELLASVSELVYGDIYYRDGELFSATLGEQEHQVDDSLAEAFQSLTDEEKQRVIKETSAGMFSGKNDGRFIYTSDNYSRWIMLADEERLTRKLKKFIKIKTQLKAV